jgi:hypothetical protein
VYHLVTASTLYRCRHFPLAKPKTSPLHTSRTLLIEDVEVLCNMMNAFIADTAGDAVMSTDDNHKLPAKIGGADAKARNAGCAYMMRAGCACACLRSWR